MLRRHRGLNLIATVRVVAAFCLCSICLCSSGIDTLLPFASALSTEMSSTRTASPLKIIDSHLHVWASRDEAARYPYAEGQEPPSRLSDRASTSELLKQMANADVDGALIVQPINHKYDHSYVTAAIRVSIVECYEGNISWLI